MPMIDAHDPGTICWIDLASTDAAGATAFYCDLFGWTATEPAENAGGYRMLLHDGKQVAGLAPVWGDTDNSIWSTYVASADADQTCAAAIASGGEVVMDAMDVLDAGRMAVLRDPSGAQVSVWQPGEHQGYEVQGEPGAPIWSELMTRDVAAREVVLRLGLRLDVAAAGLRRRAVHGLEAARAARGRRARDGRDLARGRRCRTGWSTSRPPTATRPLAAAASWAGSCGIRRTTSAPAAARCWRTRQGPRSRSSRCARRRNESAHPMRAMRPMQVR